MQRRDICPFSKASRLVMEPTQPPVKWMQGTFNTVKRPGREADHSLHLYALDLKILPLKKYGFKISG